MNAIPTTQKSIRRSLRVLPLLIGCVFSSGVSLAASTVAEQWVPGRLLVQPKPGLPEAEFAKILKAHGAKSLGKIEEINVHVIQLPANASEKAIAALLGKNPHLKFAERDMIVRPAGTANDKYFTNEWHLAKTGAPSAWDSSVGTNVVIAILDTGIDSSHPDLAGKFVSGWNVYDNTADTSDVNGHGTGVAATAVALTNNSTGVAAVAPGALLMPVRIADANATATASAVAQGLTWAADHGANVANVSYENVSGNATIQSAAQYMKNKGGLVVVAAGNSGVEENVAASSTMISVSATDSTDTKTSWSSYGSYVDLSAPGVNIYTATKGGNYGIWWGTSVASPVVAGAVALVMAANPALGPTDIESLLFSTAVDLGAVGFDKLYGYGRVNIAGAVQAALSATPADTVAPTVSFSSPSAGATVTGIAAVNVAASDNAGVSRVELWANGQLVGADTTSPYGFSWDSSTVSDGAATLLAYAYDASGNFASTSVAIKVANVADTTAPIPTIKNPISGAKVSGVVSVSASATDNVAVAKLNLYLDGKQVATASGTSLTYSWNTKKASAGSHTLRLDAFDAAGNMGSQTISVTK